MNDVMHFNVTAESPMIEHINMVKDLVREKMRKINLGEKISLIYSCK